MKISDTIEERWKKILQNEFEKSSFVALEKFLDTENEKFEIFPPKEMIFSALNKTPFDKISVVILGQDPYHGKEQANGLSFSVSSGVKIPPSLRNIYKEIESDLGIVQPKTGNLESWAKQGVLLLNSTLTVRESLPGSHQNKGWEVFSDAVIREISERKKGVVFLLWGKFAQSKEVLIDSKKHFVLKSTHPSPFSAYRGFLGCKHFSKTNEILEKLRLPKINWKLD